MHDLCLEVLTVHCNALRLFWIKAFPPTHTISVAYLTKQHWVPLLTSVAMAWFVPRIEPIAFPTMRYVLRHRRGLIHVIGDS